MESFNIAGMGAPTIERVNNDKIDNIDGNNDGIMSISTIPRAYNQNPLVLPDTLEDDDANSNDNDSSTDDLS
jgi:hypothetical protein